MIRVVKVAGLATVQDQGRPGWMHRGLPPGGALVPEALARANRAAGNAPGAACVELIGAIALANEARADVAIGVDDGRVIVIEPGESARIASDGGRPRYVAPRGGIDVPVAWGGRGTLLVARLGGHEGRALRRGDGLAIADDVEGAEARALDAEPPREPAPPIRVIAGPDRDRFEPGAIDALLGAAYRVSPSSDRVGARLEGPSLRLARGAAARPSRSSPMVRGAIEVPPSGAPIVLGPDHPTTGGYPVIAVVVRADAGAVYATGIGGSVRFALAAAPQRSEGRLQFDR